MKLYATPLSHFARKVRLVLDLYSVNYEFIDIGSVTQIDPQQFANNPLMSVPVLEDGPVWMVESDHIASYIARKIDPLDKLNIQTIDPINLNIRAILNGIMSNEVELILSKRMLVPTEKYQYFQKRQKTIEQGLNWLERNAEHFSTETPSYQELHLICAWDHLAYYDILPLSPFENLKKIVKNFSKISQIEKSAPHILKPK